MKVIIADDEVHICSLIKHLINWDELRLEFAGSFLNGTEVVNYLSNNEADILICDIEMPGMNGVELMAKLSQTHPQLQIIVVSGFRNFEYAQTSMKYGVTNYLLKPVDETELNNTLLAIIKNTKKGKLASSVIGRTVVRLQLLNLIEDNQKNINIQKVNAKYHYEFKNGQFNILQIMFLGSNASAEHMPLIMKMFTDILRPKFSDFCYDLEFFCINAVSMQIIINYSADNSKIMQPTLDSLLQETILEFSCKTQIKCFIGVGKPVENFADIYECSKLAKRIVCDRLLNTSKRIFYAGFASEKYFEAEYELVSFFEKRELLRIIEAIDLDATEMWIKNFFRVNEKKLMAKPWLTFEYCSRIIELLCSILNEICCPIDDKEFFAPLKKIVLYSSVSIAEVEKTLTDIVTTEIKERLAEKLENVSAYVQQVKNYIDRNYSKNVTLEKLASELHINPTYLSIIFKNEMNINYCKYLTMVRMEKAKELLKDCNKNLTQISNAVGYDRTPYFSKIFKKHTGLKPSEYQRLHQHNIGS